MRNMYDCPDNVLFSLLFVCLCNTSPLISPMNLQFCICSTCFLMEDEYENEVIEIILLFRHTDGISNINNMNCDS